MPLTKRQKEILDFLEAFMSENGYAPSFEEIARHFGYTSLATVHEHLENLKQKGYIRKSYNASRSLELVPSGIRSEEHTSELQSQSNLVCRLLLEKKKKIKTNIL